MKYKITINFEIKPKYQYKDWTHIQKIKKMIKTFMEVNDAINEYNIKESINV
jgi:hypothetical protein